MLGDIEFDIDREGSKIYIIGKRGYRTERVRIPIHDYKRVESGDAKVAVKYLDELVKKLKTGRLFVRA